MKLEKATRDQITRNVILSLFIYLLPIALMSVTFLVTGERPWEKKHKPVEKIKSITNKNNGNNGSND